MSDGLDPENGQIVTAIGWGKDSDESDGLSRLLREVNIPIMDNFDCNSVYGNVNDGNISGLPRSCVTKKRNARLFRARFWANIPNVQRSCCERLR